MADGGTADVMIPTNAAEVAAVFRKASLTDTPVFVYHRNLSQAGIKLDLSKLNRIIDIDTANLVATVEPGVRLSDLQTALAEKGLRFVPAAHFYGAKMLGELIYEGCANLSGQKYGFTKHFLMGSEMVLPTGEQIKTGGKTVKNVTGYDFTRFFNGPYADLGVAVSFQLKLLPVPEARTSLAVAFAALKDVFGFLRLMNTKQLVASSCIWLDPLVRNKVSSELKQAEQLVLLEFDGVEAEVEEQVAAVKKLMQTCQGVCLEETHGLSDMALRFSELYVRQDVLTDEFKVPAAMVPDYLVAAYEMFTAWGKRAGFFGQLQEGKVNLFWEKTLDGTEQEYIQSLCGLAKNMGGAASGKYARVFGLEVSDPLLALEQQVKRQVDPQAILNRRKEV